MGFIDFDSERYWDVRSQVNYIPSDVSKLEKVTRHGKTPLVLPSDTTYRPDSCTMQAGDVEAAQLRKNELEEIQRNDRKLREAAE